MKHGNKIEEPFVWENYEDGSGSMKTKFGHSFYSYDITTDEIQYPNGKYRSLSDDWRNDAEAHYMNTVLSKETRYMDLLQKGIYAPYFKGYTFNRDLESAKFVEVNESYMMSKDVFMNLVNDMRVAEDRHFSDKTISPHEAMGMVRRVIEKDFDKKDSFELVYENETFNINKSDLQPLPSNNEMKGRELPCVSKDDETYVDLSL